MDLSAELLQRNYMSSKKAAAAAAAAGCWLHFTPLSTVSAGLELVSTGLIGFFSPCFSFVQCSHSCWSPQVHVVLLDMLTLKFSLFKWWIKYILYMCYKVCSRAPCTVFQLRNYVAGLRQQTFWKDHTWLKAYIDSSIFSQTKHCTPAMICL